MKIQIKKLNEKAIIPKRATVESAGIDLCACISEPLTIKSNERALIPTGLSISIPKGYVSYIFARSGLAVKHGITLSNCVGVIDSDYRGELKVGLINQSNEDYTINPDDRIAQLVVQKIELPDIEEVSELSDTKRSTGGFGSTGK